MYSILGWNWIELSIIDLLVKSELDWFVAESLLTSLPIGDKYFGTAAGVSTDPFF